MRLTTAIWFAVFMRLETQRGAYVCIARRGAEQSGAVFVVHNLLDGTFTLYGPAPQSFFDEDNTQERMFELVHEAISKDELDTYLEKQVNFDPDLWIVETESGDGPVSLEIVS